MSLIKEAKGAKAEEQAKAEVKAPDWASIATFLTDQVNKHTQQALLNPEPTTSITELVKLGELAQSLREQQAPAVDVDTRSFSDLSLEELESHIAKLNIGGSQPVEHEDASKWTALGRELTAVISGFEDRETRPSGFYQALISLLCERPFRVDASRRTAAEAIAAAGRRAQAELDTLDSLKPTVEVRVSSADWLAGKKKD